MFVFLFLIFWFNSGSYEVFKFAVQKSAGQEIMHFTFRQEKYFMNMEKTTCWSTSHHSLQCNVVSTHSNVTYYIDAHSACIPLKPTRLWNAAPSKSQSRNSAGQADSSTFFSSSSASSIHLSVSHGMFTAHHHHHHQHHYHHHHHHIKTRSSGFFAVLMCTWLFVYMCVREQCISLCMIRYHVFIKSSSVPAQSSLCFFVPARPVRWLAHIIAP